jgi:hypothetical protein
MILWLMLACAGGDGDKADDTAGAGADGGADGGDEPAPEADPPDPDGEIALGDENNYTFDGVLDGPTYPVAEKSDVRLDWSQLSKDLQCHDLDPAAEIDNLSLLVFPYLSQEEIEAGLSADNLEQSELGLYISYEPGEETDALLTDFTFFGTDPEIVPLFEADAGTWMLLLTTGTTIGVGARMIAFLEPAAGGPESASITGGCDVLDYESNLSSLKPISVLADGPWQVDWSALTIDGRTGDELDLDSIDEVMIGRYPGLELSDLESQFLDIELIADGLWRLDPDDERSVDLSLAVDEEGGSFPGFDAGAAWVLALRCTTCSNPAPPFLTVLEPWTER